MPSLALTQKTVRVDVAFYDDAERQKLLRYPSGPAIEQITAKPLDVPTPEFLTYYLYHRKRLGTPGYRDYQSIGQKLQVALASLDGCVISNGHSICTPPGAPTQLTEISEHIGEAIGLSVASRIHGLTAADWSPLEPQRGRGAAPSFDFQIASDGEKFIQAENKGSSVQDNRLLDTTVQAQKRRIDDKKRKLAALAKEGKDPYPASLRYGTITALDARKDGNVRCWLSDPPPGQVDVDPRHFRLLNRMRFLRDWISFISPRSALASAVATRASDMEAMRNPFELDGVPLRRGNAEVFRFDPFSPARGRHSAFMSSKSRVTDGPAGGVVVQLSDRELMVLGIREDLLILLSEQVFESIAGYRSEVGSIDKAVECTFSAGRFRRLRLPGSTLQSARRTSGYFRFRLRGTLHYSPEGLVFGILPLPQE